MISLSGAHSLPPCPETKNKGDVTALPKPKYNKWSHTTEITGTLMLTHVHTYTCSQCVHMFTRAHTHLLTHAHTHTYTYVHSHIHTCTQADTVEALGNNLLACRLEWRMFPWLLFGLTLVMVNGDNLANKGKRVPFPFKTRQQEPEYYTIIAMAIQLYQTTCSFLMK